MFGVHPSFPDSSQVKIVFPTSITTLANEVKCNGAPRSKAAGFILQDQVMQTAYMTYR